jgi:hypothetical protein
MSYRFQSRAGGDVLLLHAAGEQVLRAMNRLVAPQGIIETEAMPAALRALKAAIELETAQGVNGGETSTATQGDGISLRQRARPLMQLLRQAQADGAVVVWRV